ncbi:MAG: hypothetical protein KIH62_000070 [Candidatus Kerfeldbacteria bacterium]|nr:hypothetical protein [Candidatus Kerfeldbacteria bacterium]
MIHRFATVTEEDIARITPSDIVICTDEVAPQNTDTLLRADRDEFSMLLHKCNELDVPVLAQGVYARLLAYEYGGVVQPQQHKAEQGSVLLFKLAPARDDAWLSGIEHEQSAISFRSDDIMQLPLLALPLQNSELTQFHTFKIVGKMQYGVQWYNQDLVTLFIKNTTHHYEKITV